MRTAPVLLTTLSTGLFASVIFALVSYVQWCNLATRTWEVGGRRVGVTTAVSIE